MSSAAEDWARKRKEAILRAQKLREERELGKCEPDQQVPRASKVRTVDLGFEVQNPSKVRPSGIRRASPIQFPDFQPSPERTEYASSRRRGSQQNDFHQAMGVVNARMERSDSKPKLGLLKQRIRSQSQQGHRRPGANVPKNSISSFVSKQPLPPRSVSAFPRRPEEESGMPPPAMVPPGDLYRRFLSKDEVLSLSRMPARGGAPERREQRRQVVAPSSNEWSPPKRRVKFSDAVEEREPLAKRDRVQNDPIRRREPPPAEERDPFAKRDRVQNDPIRRREPPPAEERDPFAKRDRVQNDPIRRREPPPAEERDPFAKRDHFNAEEEFDSRSPPDNPIPSPERSDMFGAGSRDGGLPDEYGDVGPLVPCRICGRTFSEEKIQRHQVACRKANKKRKVFKVARVEGAPAVKRTAEVKPKKTSWKNKSEQFRAAMRSIKGGEPAPPVVDESMVSCPHCGRTFNEDAAKRHVAICVKLGFNKSRSKPRGGAKLGMAARNSAAKKPTGGRRRY